MQLLLVESDPHRRRNIKCLLHQLDGNIDCSASINASDAFEKLSDYQPDLIILNSHLEDLDGICLINSLKNPPPFIFLTDRSDFAQTALDYHALDCLTTPVHRQRLECAIRKAKKIIDSERSSGLMENESILIKDGSQCWYPQVGKIRILKTNGNYTCLYFDDQQALAHHSLHKLEKRLPAPFFRANRQMIINLNYINKIESGPGETFEIEMTCGYHIRMTRRRSKLFREMKEL